MRRARTASIDRLMIQNDSTGFDQKCSGSMRRARPPQADVVAAHRHLARDLGVVRLPRIVQAVRAREREVEEEAEQDHEQADSSLGEAVQRREAHSGEGARCYSPGGSAIARSVHAGILRGIIRRRSVADQALALGRARSGADGRRRRRRPRRCARRSPRPRCGCGRRRCAGRARGRRARQGRRAGGRAARGHDGGQAHGRPDSALPSGAGGRLRRRAHADRAPARRARRR